MAESLPDPLLEQFSGFLAARVGLHFPRSRWGDMLRGLQAAARRFGLPDAEACMRRLMTTPLQQSQIETLASHLTVGETYFFREPAVFAALERHVLPPLIAERAAAGRQLRLWSAGCCTGEEAFSLAILLSRLIPDIERWNLTLLATDINPQFLGRARRGEFREWSFRAAPPWLRDGYFMQPVPGTYRLHPRIRELVSFAYLNLVDDVYPSLATNTNGMDIVFCRNVLMYFESATRRAVMDKLHRSLGEGGWLVVSPVEAAAVPLPGFTPVEFADALLYRKVGEGARSAASTPRAPSWVSEAPVPWEFAPPPSPPRSAPASSDMPAVRYEQALACYAQGAYARAADLLAAAPRGDARALALAARACANLGRLDEAHRWGEAAVAADRCDPALRYLLASVQSEQGRSEAAVAALRQALYLDPDFALAHFALGNLYRRLGRDAHAARHFGQARALLARMAPDRALPDAEGLAAGRLLAILDNAEGIA